MSNTGHYYFDKMPKEVQEEFKKAYDNCKGKACELDEFLSDTYSSHCGFVTSSFYFDESPQGDSYWYRVANEEYPLMPINNSIEGDVAQFYTPTDLVSFGNYLLSDARRESIMSNHETSPEAKEELLKQVTDADISNWENLNITTL